MKPRIYYFVPESRDVPAGGILTLINHVSALNALGCEAYAVSERPLTFSWANLPFPQRLLSEVAPQLTEQDVVVVPEGNPKIRERHLARAGRAVLIALSYRYIPEHQLGKRTFADLGYSHIITSGQSTADVVRSKPFCGGLPISVVRESLGSCADLFYPEPASQAENSVMILANKNVLQAYLVHFGLRLMRVRGKIPHVPIRIVSDLNQGVFASIVRSCDIVVVPYTREGFGRVPLEAMLADSAVATYRSSGPDYLADGDNALVASDNRADRLLKCVARLIRDGDLKRRVKAGGRVTTANYSQEKQNEDLIAFYSSLGFFQQG